MNGFPFGFTEPHGPNLNLAPPVQDGAYHEVTSDTVREIRVPPAYVARGTIELGEGTQVSLDRFYSFPGGTRVGIILESLIEIDGVNVAWHRSRYGEANSALTIDGDTDLRSAWVDLTGGLHAVRRVVRWLSTDLTEEMIRSISVRLPSVTADLSLVVATSATTIDTVLIP